MAYNHGKELRKFLRKWKKLRKEYKEAGMSDEAIEEMFLFDKNEFKRNRVFMEHIHFDLPKNNSGTDGEEDDNDFEQEDEEFKVAVSDEYSAAHSRYWWVERIENPKLVAYLKSLSREELEFITLFYIDRYTQKEIAKILNISQQAVSKRIVKIEKNKKN